MKYSRWRRTTPSSAGVDMPLDGASLVEWRWRSLRCSGGGGDGGAGPWPQLEQHAAQTRAGVAASAVQFSPELFISWQGTSWKLGELAKSL